MMGAVIRLTIIKAIQLHEYPIQPHERDDRADDEWCLPAQRARKRREREGGNSSTEIEQAGVDPRGQPGPLAEDAGGYHQPGREVERRAHPCEKSHRKLKVELATGSGEN